MVMPGTKMYIVSCTKCFWKRQKTVNMISGIFDGLLGMKIPKKCPKCKGEIKKQELPVLF